MNKRVFLINIIITVVVLIATVIFFYFAVDKDETKNESTSASSTTQEQAKESGKGDSTTPQIQVEPKQESATQSVESPTESQIPSTASVANAPSDPSVDYEQKFGKRIYLATKDDFVNMRKAPSGEIITQIYKKDFADIMVFSFDTNSNEKWLKVAYFPPNSKDEKDAILGYIHISQIDKSRF